MRRIFSRSGFLNVSCPSGVEIEDVEQSTKVAIIATAS